MIKQIDRRIMAALSWATSTKSAFYALNLVILTAVILDPPRDLQAWLLVLVSEYYQGIALPGLGAAQRTEAEETRRILQETHDVVMAELQELRQTVTYLHERLDNAPGKK